MTSQYFWKVVKNKWAEHVKIATTCNMKANNVYISIKTKNIHYTKERIYPIADQLSKTIFQFLQFWQIKLRRVILVHGHYDADSFYGIAFFDVILMNPKVC